MSAAVEWHGEKGYLTCGICGKLVQINKRVFGANHFCLTSCQRARRHLDVVTRRRGPFWRRRSQDECRQCGAIDQ